MPLIIVENGPKKGARFALEADGSLLGGRDPQAAIPLVDPMVSRHHFRIEREGEGFVISDLGSANGTAVNGARIQKRPLKRGDRIQAGETLLTFFPEAEEDPLIGKRISGFEVIERIGQGGMGTVYKARQVSLDRMVALKVLSRELADNHTFSELFHREARAAGQINHPSIVQVYDVDSVKVDAQEVTFFAMEYMPGGSVEDLLNREKTLQVERALEIALDTARGLQFAEKHGLVHRDIKPGNLMISESGAVKIGDLGIARRADAGSRVSQKDGVSGSPHYIAPEQAQGKDLDSRADIYSLGISLFHLLAGRPPFVGSIAKELVLKHIHEKPPEIGKFRSDVPPAVAAIIERTMEKDREKRFPGPEALAAALERTLAEVRAAALEAQGRPGGKFRRLARRALPVAGILAVLAAAGAGGGMLFQEIERRRTEAAEEEEKFRSRLETAFAEIEKAIDANRLDEAQSFLDQVDRSLAGNPAGRARFPEIAGMAAGKASALAKRIDEEKAAAGEARRRAEAEARLKEVLAAAPPDLAVVLEPARIEKLIEALEQAAGDFPGTPAAGRAATEIRRAREALRLLESKLRRSEDAWLSLDRNVTALLGFDPPQYRDALKGLREFPEEFAGTEADRRRRERLLEIERSMQSEAEKLVRDALEAAQQGKRSEALRKLERLRVGFEGKALEIIEAAIASLGE